MIQTHIYIQIQHVDIIQTKMYMQILKVVPSNIYIYPSLTNYSRCSFWFARIRLPDRMHGSDWARDCIDPKCN